MHYLFETREHLLPAPGYTADNQLQQVYVKEALDYLRNLPIGLIK